MHVIPVVDIRDGRAVAACAGKRDKYAPVNSRLCSSSGVIDVISAYLSYYPFRCIYIADLDAIENTGDNCDLVLEVLETQPRLLVWVDAGLHEYLFQLAKVYPQRLKIIAATETGLEPAALGHITREHNGILSLDYSSDALSGNGDIAAFLPQLPVDIILMCLHRTGTSQGPDLAGLATLRNAAAESNIYVAGGVRNYQDLVDLQHRGAAGALVATCLHNCSVDRTDIELLAKKTPVISRGSLTN